MLNDYKYIVKGHHRATKSQNEYTGKELRGFIVALIVTVVICTVMGVV